jgi:small subunit ribosomal protein S2
MAEEIQPTEQVNEVISMKQLLEAGVHFGHQISHWNPKMKEFIFGNRNGIHIIDLQQTVGLFKKAYNFVRDVAAEGGEVLFVGTKKQAQGIIAEETTRSGMPYVNTRWLGGTLTNFNTIRSRVDYLLELKKLEEEGQMELLPKKEAKGLKREIQKLELLLGGVVNMKRTPQALYIVDTRKEHIAVHEARRLGIPIVAVVDTNSDPADADFVIPSNDDAIRAIKLFTSRISDACVEGRHAYEQRLQAGEVVRKPQHDQVVVERKVFVFKEFGEESVKEEATSVAVSESAQPGDAPQPQHVESRDKQPSKPKAPAKGTTEEEDTYTYTHTDKAE